MRKCAGFILATLLIVAPALANAYMLTVKAGVGGTTTVTVGTGAAKTMTGGTSYFYPTPSQAVTVAASGSGAKINGSAGTSLTIPAGTTANQTVTTSYSAAFTYTVTVSQAAGGTISMKLPNGTYSASGATKVTPGTVLPVTFAPSMSYKLTAYQFNGGTAVSVDAAAGEVKTVDYTVGDANGSVTATFTSAPTITASISAPSTGVQSQLVSCTAIGSAQGSAVSYQWALNGSDVAGATSSTYSFTPGTAGSYTVAVKVSATGATTVTKSALVNVVSAADYASSQCVSCHSSSTPTVVADYAASGHESQNACTGCHVNLPHESALPTKSSCESCHASGNAPSNFFASKHWQNHFETGPEFANQIDTNVNGAVVTDLGTRTDGYLNANDSYLTTENGGVVTCAYRCHFRPGMGPDPTRKSTGGLTYTDPQTGVVYSREGGDSCMACHEPHNVNATYKSTCLTCHSGSKHGKVPNEFFASKHWQNNFEYGPEFANQIDTTVSGGSVVNTGTKTAGYLNANDSYQTTEDGALVTCAYRCHFRPGMGPDKNVGTVLANGKATGYVSYTDTTGKYGPASTVYSRPGGDACMACHDSHGLDATAQSTCYTCHSGGNHGWSVAAFEKSTHFTGSAAKADGMDKEACVACHNAHSLEAEFANMSTASALHTAGLATGCQKCHTAGATVTVPGVGTFDISIFNADGTGKAPHFQTGTAGADGYYATGSYDGGGATCVDCHYHNNSINAGWAKGSHASTTSVPLVTSAADNWNRGTKRGAVSNGRTYTGDYTINAQVSDCQRCHTAAGFKLFYDSGFKNVSTAREGIKTSGPITCDACHVAKTAGTKLYNGKVRPLAAGVTNMKTYVGNAKYLTNAADAVTTSMDFPANYANSNVCVPCHAGRGTGALIKASFAAGTVIGDETSADNPRDILRIGTAIYPHFASAAGVVNGTSAYEFNPPAVASTHNKIGTGAGFGTTSTTMGPCVGCHMSSTTEAHSLESVTYDADGKITGFATTACANCHGVSTTAITPAGVQATKENFEAALNVLRNLLLNRGFDGLQAEIDARPGERVKMNMALGYTAYAAAGGTLTIKDFAERNTGAAFNWWQFGKSYKDGKTIILGDPAAYVHNPTYARQVIMESIDWLDDFQLNSSAAAAIDAQVGAPVKTYAGVADGVPVDAAAAAKAKAFLGL